MEYTNKELLKKIETGSADVMDCTTSANPTTVKKVKKKNPNEDFKRKYFDYYDDVKTNIKEDW